MSDPYQVLGVDRNADDDEIKKAYHDLARKYHPDKYRDSDLADLAEEKMKEINDAYDRIRKERASGGSASGGQQQSYGGTQASGGYGNYYGGSSRGYTGAGAEQFAAIRSYINQNRLAEARAVLNGMPACAEPSGTSLWAVCSYGAATTPMPDVALTMPASASLTTRNTGTRVRSCASAARPTVPPNSRRGAGAYAPPFSAPTAAVAVFAAVADAER